MKRVVWIVVVLAVLGAGGGGAWYWWTARAVGTLQPQNYVDVGVQVSGQLRKIHVTYGQKVEQGELLAEIDPTVFEARVAADQAQLLNLRAQVNERTAQRTLAERQAERQRRLMAERATSQDALDVAEAQVKATAAQIEALQAQIKQTESNLRSDMANLSYTKIYAPMAGTVVDIIARQGQTLNANQQAPLVLRYNALFDLENPEHDLLPQMSAQVFFVVSQAQNVPLVPMSALRQVGQRGNRYIARVLENGQPAERTIEIGANNRVMAEVKSGLKVGDEVLLDVAGRGGGPPAFARTPRL